MIKRTTYCLNIFLLVGLISCSSKRHYASSNSNELVKKVVSNELPSNFQKFRKSELVLINHGDSLVEGSYDFVIPKGYKSYQYSYTSAPLTTTFSYRRNQKVIVAKPIERIKDTVILEMDVKEFENTLESLSLMSSNLEFALKDVLGNRANSKYGVVLKDNIMILKLHFLKNSLESKNFELLSRLDK